MSLRSTSFLRGRCRFDRDYRGVHSDVAALRAAGLIEKNEDGLVLAPWTRITAEIAVEAAA